MRALILRLLALPLCAFALHPVAAQDFGAAFSGLSSNSDEPVQIEADRLEVNDKEKIATYTGHVHLRKGDTLLEAPELVVYYTSQEAADGAASQGTTATTTGQDSTGSNSTATNSAASRVSRMEAGPGVIVYSGTQTATGNHIVFDVANDLVTLTGNVVVTQGENVVRGQKLVVNLKTSIGHFEGGRVETLFAPSHGAAPTQ